MELGPIGRGVLALDCGLGKPLIHLCIFYGSDKILSADMPEDLRLAMLSSDADAARKEIERCFPIHNPMTRFGVVWTTRGYYLSRKVTKHVDTNFVLRANQQPEYIPPDIE